KGFQQVPCGKMFPRTGCVPSAAWANLISRWNQLDLGEWLYGLYPEAGTGCQRLPLHGECGRCAHTQSSECSAAALCAGAVVSWPQLFLDRRRMLGERRDLDGHERKQRQLAQHVVQLIIGFCVEYADVGIFADDAPDVLPFAGTLQVLRILLFLGLDACSLFGRKTGGNIDGHVHHEQHGNLLEARNRIRLKQNLQERRAYRLAMKSESARLNCCGASRLDRCDAGTVASVEPGMASCMTWASATVVTGSSSPASNKVGTAMRPSSGRRSDSARASQHAA